MNKNKVNSVRSTPDLCGEIIRIRNISPSVENFDKTNSAKNCRNGYAVEKHKAYRLSKISIPNFNTKIEYLNQDCVKISRHYL